MEVTEKRYKFRPRLFLSVYLLFDESSSWSQMLFLVLKLVVFSFLTPPPRSNMQKKHNETSDCVDSNPSLREKLLRAVNFFSPNFTQPWWTFTGKCWLRGVRNYQKLSAAQLKRSFDSNPQEKRGGAGEDRDERNRLIRESLRQPSS